MSPLIQPAQSKIYSLDKLVKLREAWRKKGHKVVFTNGCFDILHAGHIKYLEEAASKGQRLIIGVNDDDSVTRLKGETRPINQLSSRLYLLASLRCVDAVCSFSEDTPLMLINVLKPDILAKGGDYKVSDVVGAKEVLGWGGEVIVVPYVEGHSTTKIENKIMDLYRKKKNKET